MRHVTTMKPFAPILLLALAALALFGTPASADPRVCLTQDSSGVYHDCAGVNNYYCTAYYQNDWPTGWPVVGVGCIDNSAWQHQPAVCPVSGSIGSYGCVGVGGVGSGQCALYVIVATQVTPTWVPLLCIP